MKNIQLISLVLLTFLSLAQAGEMIHHDEPRSATSERYDACPAAQLNASKVEVTCNKENEIGTPQNIRVSGCFCQVVPNKDYDQECSVSTEWDCDKK
jgi:hypothetical protein